MSASYPIPSYSQDDERPSRLPRTDPFGARSSMAENLAAISATIDATYPDTMDRELVLRRRVGKIGVEWGELCEAIEGYTGENPRKGVFASHEDMLKEILDCAASALGAYEHETGNKGLSMQALADHLAFQRRRLDAAMSDAAAS